MLFLIWRTGMQAQVDLLRHQVAATQAQLSAAADSGQSQISGLSRDVNGLRHDVNAVSGLASYKGECTADASGPSGVAVYVLPCRR
jgi:outer membrane murein-binding lipoprotein Lpp